MINVAIGGGWIQFKRRNGALPTRFDKIGMVPSTEILNQKVEALRLRDRYERLWQEF